MTDFPKKKQLSKNYIERLNQLVEWLSNCEYTMGNDIQMEQGGLVVSGDELVSASNISFTLTVTKQESWEDNSNGVQSDKDFVHNKMKDVAGKREIKQYYEISLTKTVDGIDHVITDVLKNTEATGTFRITMEIPEEFRGYKHYSVLHVHNGETILLADLDDNPDTITFEVNKFSTFALTATNETLSASSDGEWPGASDLIFQMNADKQGYTVVGRVTDALHLVIPSYYKGLPVTRVEMRNMLGVEHSNEDIGSDASKPIIMPFDPLEPIEGPPLASITFCSKTIEILDEWNALPDSVLIYGCAASTAQSYAESTGKPFVVLSQIKSANIALGSDITLNYHVMLNDEQKDAVLKVTMDGKTVTLTGTPTGERNKYLFSFEGIIPQMMGVNVAATLMLGDEILAEKQQYSVKDYCLNMLNKVNDKALSLTDAQYAALGTLIADLLEYGAAAQKYVNYRTDALVNANVTSQSIFAPMGEEYAAPKLVPTTAADKTSFISVHAVLENRIRLKVVLGTTDVSRVTVKLDDTVYSAEDLMPYDHGTAYGIPTYVLSVKALTSTELDKAFTLTLCVDGEECQTLTYGMANYIYSKQNDADIKLQALVRAIRNYGLSAKAYQTAMAQ